MSRSSPRPSPVTGADRGRGPDARRPAVDAALLALLLSGLLSLTPVSAVHGSSVAELHWLEGRWQRQGRSGAVWEEWRRAGNVLEGEAWRIDAEGERVQLEDLLLVDLGGETFYFAAVGENRWPTPFRLTVASENRAVFENPDHDDPRRITYLLRGDDLLVVLDGEGPARELRFRRQP